MTHVIFYAHHNKKVYFYYYYLLYCHQRLLLYVSRFIDEALIYTVKHAKKKVKNVISTPQMDKNKSHAPLEQHKKMHDL